MSSSDLTRRTFIKSAVFAAAAAQTLAAEPRGGIP
jgi:hypothetical protein